MYLAFILSHYINTQYLKIREILYYAWLLPGYPAFICICIHIATTNTILHVICFAQIVCISGIYNIFDVKT